MMTEAIAAVVAVVETSNYREVSDSPGIRMEYIENRTVHRWRMDIQAENSLRIRERRLILFYLILESCR